MRKTAIEIEGLHAYSFSDPHVNLQTQAAIRIFGRNNNQPWARLKTTWTDLVSENLEQSQTPSAWFSGHHTAELTKTKRFDHCS